MEWAAEYEMTAGAAAALVGERFPDLRGAPVEPLATGWDNTVFRVGGDWAFRFPRRKIAVPGVEREIATLAALAPRLPLPIPVPRYVGEPGGGFPWPFFGARLVPGRELAEARPPDGRRAPIAAAVGGFLRALHDPALVPVAGAGLPVDPFRRGDPAHRAAAAAERLARLAALGLWEPDAAVRGFLDAARDAAPPAGEPVIVHGDLHVRHVLIGPAGEAAGVIDWGDVCRADPSVDLSVAYAAFAGGDRAAFLDAYGPVPPDRERAARVLALFITATLAEYAASEGLAALLGESLAGIGRVLAP
ncbi:phosphotransferase [Spirillospora sp. NPDC052242]